MIPRYWCSFAKRFASSGLPARNVATFREEKISRLPNGLAVASVDLGGPVSQLVIAYKAGTRYEMPDEAGLVHHIRNCFGGDSSRYYGAQLLWQCGSAGASVNSMMTRDLLGVQMSVIRDHAQLGLSLLGELAQPAFKPWDVEDFSEALNIDRSYLKPYDMLMEKLHDAAFRNGPLGNRLFAKEKSIGKFSYRKMQIFAASQMVTGNAVLVGVNIPHELIVDYASSQFTLPEGSPCSVKPSKYYGGEERHKTLLNEAHVAIAGRGAPLTNLKGLATQAVLSAAFGQGASAKYAVGAGQGAIAKAIFKASNGYPFGFDSISEVYSDEGLVGIYLVSEPDHIGTLCDAAVKAIKSFKIDDSVLETSKNIAKMNVLTRAESAENLAVDRAAQILATGKAETVSDLLQEITSVTISDVAKAADQMRSKLSLASHGNIYQVPYLDQL